MKHLILIVALVACGCGHSSEREACEGRARCGTMNLYDCEAWAELEELPADCLNEMALGDCGNDWLQACRVEERIGDYCTTEHEDSCRSEAVETRCIRIGVHSPEDRQYLFLIDCPCDGTCPNGSDETCTEGACGCP
ncbi:MAG TPA: hypothetical protein PLC99_24220 [Verrucomicrobiota bacterium]|nr:hypothetical protein [Verrucomicrobiota bacterium]